MKRWRETNVRFHLGIAAAFALAAALALGLVYSFNQYKDQIIEEQEEQLLTIAKAVSNSISVYTDFYFADLLDVNTYDEYQEAGKLYLETGDIPVWKLCALSKRMGSFPPVTSSHNSPIFFMPSGVLSVRIVTLVNVYDICCPPNHI